MRGNLGLHVGDVPALVEARRRRLSRSLGRRIVWMDQTHSTRVAVLTRGPGSAVRVEIGGEQHLVPEARVGEGRGLPVDGVLCDARGWKEAPALAVMTADCLPIVLSDPSGLVVAAVHAGRVGLDGGILAEAVRAFERRGVPAHLVRARIGAAICGSCYEVPAALRDEVGLARPAAAATTSWGTPSLDLPRAALEELGGVGVAARWTGECTLEEGRDHSYRRCAQCGRQALLVVPGAAGGTP